MALIDDLTRSITAELHRTLDQAIRKAVVSYVVGNGQNARSAGSSAEESYRPGRRGRPPRRKPAKTSRENRSRTIIDAVAKLGEASIEDVARVTGMDKRGVGSSLHYLAEAGKLKHLGTGKYKAGRARV